MRNVLLGLFVTLCPIAAFSDVLLVSPEAAYASDNAVAENVRNECNLPAAQTKSVLAALAAQGVDAEAASDDAVPGKGRFLQLRIDSATSAGNAFTGHRKEVVTSARLFENGREVAENTFTRHSGGGMFGGFKGACGVLQRCTTTLGKDIAEWVRSQ